MTKEVRGHVWLRFRRFAQAYGRQATVYAVTYVQGSDGVWTQLGQLYEGTSTIQDYNSTDDVYEGAFDVANWQTVPNTTYKLFGNVQYTIVHSGGQDEFRCRTIEDLMTAKVNDFANYINSLQSTVTTISRVVYTYTKVGNEEIATPNQANESKSGYIALKAAFDKIKDKNLLLINNGGSAQFVSNEARSLTRAELVSLLVELDTAYSYYLEANWYHTTAEAVALDNPNYVLPANTTTEYTIWTDSYKVVGDLIPNSVKIAVSEAVSEAVSDIASELSSALESALENAFNSFMDQLKGKLSKVLG